MIFSRRAVQEALNQLRKRMDSPSINNLAKRLNTPGKVRISAMWEVIIITSLQRMGNVECEQELSSGRRPDIFFDNGNGLEFFADITCISDENLDKENPIEHFHKTLLDAISKLGLPLGGHDLRVESKKISTSRGSKIILRLPSQANIPKFIAEKIIPELKSLMATTSERYLRIVINNEEAGLTLSVDRTGGQFNSMGHASYDKPSIVDRNPLFNALRAKSKQLKSADGIKGIIVCDGDSRSLSKNGPHQGDDAYFICNEFFRQHNSIDFIMLISVEEIRKNPLRPQEVDRITTARMASRNGFTRLSEIERIFDSALKHFPTPVNSPVNAVYRARDQGYGIGNLGGFSMSGNKLRVSSRAVMDVLSGRKSVEQFNRDHQWNETSGNLIIKNPFERYLIEGRLPVKVLVEPDDDDDWIEFEFGDRDSAISDFY
ncbi:hypothetical protein N5J70_16295 [Pseudomonas sp. GD03909]|nr:hypothetical protein [Pseudomonas sp. GD03909]